MLVACSVPARLVAGALLAPVDVLALLAAVLYRHGLAVLLHHGLALLHGVVAAHLPIGKGHCIKEGTVK